MRVATVLLLAALGGCASPDQRAADDCRGLLVSAPGTRAFADCARDQTWAYEDEQAARRPGAAAWLGVAAVGAALAVQPAQSTTTTVWWWR